MERDIDPDFLAGTGAMAVSGKTKASLQKEKEGRKEGGNRQIKDRQV